MTIYQTKGVLTGTIEPENVALAQHYLHFDHEGKPLNMQQFLAPPLNDVVLSLAWGLFGNGHDYTITAVTSRELTDAELKQLSSEVSGQNSDGLGEGFEQQDFAWNEEGCDEDDDCPGGCEGYGCEEGSMVSFDWQTNELPWEKIG